MAGESSALLAGDICNTNVFTGDGASRATVRIAARGPSSRSSRRSAARWRGTIAALPVPYRTREDQPSFQSLRDPGYRDLPDGRPFQTALDPFTCTATRSPTSPARRTSGVDYLGVCCGAGPQRSRAMAEALGRRPPTSSDTADMSKHALPGR